MSKTKVKASEPKSSKAADILVYGTDENNKPRAARFSGDNPDAIAKAALAMALTVCEVTMPELAELGKKLPAGRLYSNGRGFVPYIRRELFADLVRATGGYVQQEKPSAEQATAHGLPPNWQDIAVGQLVVAQEHHESGWWEAIVVARENDMLTLRWRDFPKHPTSIRHVAAVALLSPSSP